MQQLGLLPRMANIAWMLALLLTVGQAQRESVTLTLGYDNELVSGRWNPLRIVTRDVPAAELVMTFDQGSLQVGAVPAEYRVELPGGSGISVFEDDLFIPAFRALTWRLVAGGQVLASGGYDRRSIDAEPVHLILSANPGRYLNIYANLRTVDIGPGELPARLAAYDGVASLLLDGSTAAPSLDVISAAMTAGVSVYLLPELPASYAEIVALAAAYPQLGLGSLQQITPEALPDALAVSQLASWRDATAALMTPDLLEYPEAPPQLLLFAAVAGYLLLLLLLLRFGGAPGLLSSLLLAGFAAMMAWGYVRSDASQLEAARTLELSRGPLARVERVHSLISLPAQEIRREGAAAPQGVLPYRQTDTATQFTAARWSQSTWVERPRLATASFFWQQGELVNRRNEPLSAVYVIGLGAQRNLAAGERLMPEPGETSHERYRDLIPYLPEGTALAMAGEAVFAALPTE
jgi:hypothetical protein